MPLTAPPKLLQPWQAFQKKYHVEYKERLDNEWQDYIASLDECTKPKSRFEFTSTFFRQLYDEALPEVKQGVDDYRLALKEQGERSLDGFDEASTLCVVQQIDVPNTCSPIYSGL